MEHLFVYGSLRKGTDRSKAQRQGVGSEYARFLELNSTYIGPGKTEGRLWLLAEYPGFTDGKGIVLGDLYQVSTAVIKKLDKYEGLEFERLKRPVDGPNGEVDAWIYVYRFSPTGKKRIENGDWSSYGVESAPAAAPTPASAPAPDPEPAAAVAAADPAPAAAAEEPAPAPAAKKASKKSAK
jgi:gamma-glutamylcyclotransferase (GGCT)/AIG2-like uncharacterized protein YtfP